MGAESCQIDTANVTRVRLNMPDSEPAPHQDTVELTLNDARPRIFTLNDFAQFVGALQLAEKQAQQRFNDYPGDLTAPHRDE